MNLISPHHLIELFISLVVLANLPTSTLHFLLSRGMNTKAKIDALKQFEGTTKVHVGYMHSTVSDIAVPMRYVTAWMIIAALHSNEYFMDVVKNNPVYHGSSYTAIERLAGLLEHIEFSNQTYPVSTETLHKMYKVASAIDPSLLPPTKDTLTLPGFNQDTMAALFDDNDKERKKKYHDIVRVSANHSIEVSWIDWIDEIVLQCIKRNCANREEIFKDRQFLKDQYKYADNIDKWVYLYKLRMMIHISVAFVQRRGEGVPSYPQEALKDLLPQQPTTEAPTISATGTANVNSSTHKMPNGTILFNWLKENKRILTIGVLSLFIAGFIVKKLKKTSLRTTPHIHLAEKVMPRAATRPPKSDFPTTLIVVIVLVVVSLAGIGYYYYFYYQTDGDNENNEEQENKEQGHDGEVKNDGDVSKVGTPNKKKKMKAKESKVQKGSKFQSNVSNVVASKASNVSGVKVADKDAKKINYKNIARLRAKPNTKAKPESVASKATTSTTVVASTSPTSNASTSPTSNASTSPTSNASTSPTSNASPSPTSNPFSSPTRNASSCADNGASLLATTSSYATSIAAAKTKKPAKDSTKPKRRESTDPVEDQVDGGLEAKKRHKKSKDDHGSKTKRKSGAHK